jgi:hypothetical protein
MKPSTDSTSFSTVSQASSTEVSSIPDQHDETSEKAIAGDRVLKTDAPLDCNPEPAQRAVVSAAYTEILHNGGHLGC